MARPVKSHVFRGKRYSIEHHNASILRDRYGDCDPPDKKGKRIRLYKGMLPRKALEVAVHEATHALSWDWTEETVTEFAKDLSNFLWRLGYRKVDNGSKRS